MSNNFLMPTPDSTKEILSMVLGDGLAINNEENDSENGYIATYIDDEDKLVALCTCDLPFVAYSSAALSMIPAGVANEMIKDNELNDNVLANFHEVMNICSKLMMSDDTDHLRLEKTVLPPDSEKTVSDFEVGSKEVFTIDIPNYGKGTFSFYLGK